jgi:hypothetical protein
LQGRDASELPFARRLGNIGYMDGPVFERAGTVAQHDRLEPIRRALRSGDYHRAVALLARAPATSAGQPTIDEITAYAWDGIARTGRRTAPPPSSAPSLTRTALQRVLRWLTAEELRTGAAALSEQHLNRAIDALERALRVDGRGSRASLLLATALYRSVDRELRHAEPELGRTGEDLERATALLGVAATDRALSDRAAQLTLQVDRRRADLAALRRRRARSRALSDYVKRHNGFLVRYGKGRITMAEKSIARRSLAGLNTDLVRLRRHYPADSAEGRKLAELAEAVTTMQQRLKHVV